MEHTYELGKFRAWGWFKFPEWNITMGVPWKCGTSTLRNFIHTNGIPFYHIQHKHVHGEAYFVIRHPVDRFMSLWRQKCRDKSQNIFMVSQNKIRVPKYRTNTWDILGGASPEELMDYIEAGHSEPYWTPQVNILSKLDATCIPLENLSDWWADRGYGDLHSARINSTSGTEVLSDDLTQRILTFYAKDVELYNKSKQ